METNKTIFFDQLFYVAEVSFDDDFQKLNFVVWHTEAEHDLNYKENQPDVIGSIEYDGTIEFEKIETYFSHISWIKNFYVLIKKLKKMQKEYIKNLNTPTVDCKHHEFVDMTSVTDRTTVYKCRFCGKEMGD